MYRNPSFEEMKARLEQDWGIVMPMAMDFMKPQWKRDFTMALDAAQPGLLTTPNAGVPAWFTTFVDPEIVRILQTPNKGAEILGERQLGTWTDQTVYISVVENTGYVNSYGDFSRAGVSDINQDWEQRQEYKFQTGIEYGDLEVERAGLLRLNLVGEKQQAAVKALDKFMDLTYHFGVSGLQNYGLLNDPGLAAPINPTTKAGGNANKWIAAGTVNALASEIYADIQALFNPLSANSGGRITTDSKFRLVYPNIVAGALTAVNSFGITIKAFIKESFPNVEYVVDPRYATAAGNVVQLIATEYDGNSTGYCAFNNKFREFPAIRAAKSWTQEYAAGTYGAIIKYPLAISQMLGV
jgi:hypothetical protein